MKRIFGRLNSVSFVKYQKNIKKIMTSPVSGEEFDSKYDIIDSKTPKNTALSGQYKKSFAYYTLRERLPVILTEVIDQLNRDKDEIAEHYNGEQSREEIKYLVGLISKLKYQMLTDKKYDKFSGKEPDKDLWNNFIDQLPPNFCSFFHSCWIYAECFMYRKLSSFFESTETLKSFDYFAKQKQNNLKEAGVSEIAKLTQQTEKDFKTLDNLFKLNLMGNKSDLSIILPKTFKPGNNVFKQLETFNDSILVNDTKKVWQCLESADHSKPVIVEFICDNSGFELLTDLIVADYLIEKKFVSKIRFSVKPIPWYISDVTPSDITWSLKYMSQHDSRLVQDLATKWKSFFEEGKFVLSPVHYFWVSPYQYYKMQEIAPDLYHYLSEARLVIFKGDFNYRKLLGDVNWNPTEEFVTCLKGFQPTNICSLRTLKADLICGLIEGKAEELQRLNSDWMVSGEYGVIQFAEATVSCAQQN